MGLDRNPEFASTIHKKGVTLKVTFLSHVQKTGFMLSTYHAFANHAFRMEEKISSKIPAKHLHLQKKCLLGKFQLK